MGVANTGSAGTGSQVRPPVRAAGANVGSCGVSAVRTPVQSTGVNVGSTGVTQTRPPVKR